MKDILGGTFIIFGIEFAKYLNNSDYSNSSWLYFMCGCFIYYGFKLGIEAMIEEYDKKTREDFDRQLVLIRNELDVKQDR